MCVPQRGGGGTTGACRSVSRVGVCGHGLAASLKSLPPQPLPPQEAPGKDQDLPERPPCRPLASNHVRAFAGAFIYLALSARPSLYNSYHVPARCAIALEGGGALLDIELAAAGRPTGWGRGPGFAERAARHQKSGRVGGQNTAQSAGNVC